MRCRCDEKGRAEGPRQPSNDASSRFLTVGTGGGNSARCGLKGLYRVVFSAQWFRRHDPARGLPRNDRGGTCRSRATNTAGAQLSGAKSTKGDTRMTNPNQNPGQQNQNPGQKPGQQQGGGQKPGQQQQDPNR